MALLTRLAWTTSSSQIQSGHAALSQSPHASRGIRRGRAKVLAPLVAAALVSWSASAAAQEPSSAAPPAGQSAPAPVEEPAQPVEPSNKIQLASPEVPQTQRTYHMHDGFYFRANFGIGPLWANLNDSGVTNYDVDASGTGLGLDLLVGGSPSPGFAVGGGLITNALFSASFKQNGNVVGDRDIQSYLLGAFVDGFPSKTGPWHLGGMIGFADLKVNQDTFVDNTNGYGGAIWAGYDQWVAANFAMGGLVRLSATRTTGNKNVYDVSASGMTLTFTLSALYH